MSDHRGKVRGGRGGVGVSAIALNARCSPSGSPTRSCNSCDIIYFLKDSSTSTGAMQTPMYTALDLWAACPPDILVRCFRAQLDYTDNSGAGCACASWNQIFRACGAEVAIHQNPLNQALLSSHYLRQFSDLHTVRLAKGADWQTQSGTWLSAVPAKRFSWGPRDLAQWTETMQSIPDSCRQLVLDSFLPYEQTFLNGFSQLLNLQQLCIQGGYPVLIDLEDLGLLKQLQVLSVVGQSRSAPALVRGSLDRLPRTLKELRLRACAAMSCPSHEGFRLQSLSHMDGLDHLDLSFSTASFEMDSELVSLQMLKSILLEGSTVTPPQALTGFLSTATNVQELVLRNCVLDDGQFVLSLESLLQSLPSLQMLDVASCSHVHLGPTDCRTLRLHSFSFHYSQLLNIDVNQFNDFMQPFRSRDGSLITPLLQFEGQFPHFGYQHWVQTLPLKVLTHLTIHDAHKWPIALFFDANSATLPNLQFLDVSFASLVSSDMDGISFGSDSNLRELYIAGTSCTSVDLADCSALTSLGITHRGHETPSVSLPTSLKKLYLHNVLREGTNADLASLSDLQYLKLGGRAATTGAMRNLPDLPQTLIELDLWDGLVRGLERMTSLTNLKRLVMPLPPSAEQLPVIKHLRQLRHVDVTTMEGEPVV